MFPKMNTISMNLVKDLSDYKTAVKDNMLYIMGGKDWNTGSHIAAMWRFDPLTSQWTQLSPMTTARSRFTAEVIGDFIYVAGKMYIFFFFSIYIYIYKNKNKQNKTQITHNYT